ncbi:MAG: hypothetical protein V2I33_23455 [Kangiellaceae bacterium]|nr:hypothetical protein [Kangiellaceae bacterium]
MLTVKAKGGRKRSGSPTAKSSKAASPSRQSLAEDQITPVPVTAAVPDAGQ